jgi:hypothetical protein
VRANGIACGTPDAFVVSRIETNAGELARVAVDAGGAPGCLVCAGALADNEMSRVEIDEGGLAHTPSTGIQAVSIPSEVIILAGKVRGSSRSKLFSLSARRPRTRDSRSLVAAPCCSELVVTYMVLLLWSYLLKSHKTP